MEMSKIVIGAMRFKDRESAIATIHAAIDAGCNYIDCGPCYCYQSEAENSERWVGEAINHPDYRNRIMVSAKCSPGNGGWQLGELNAEKGFGVRSAKDLNRLFDQSKDRIGVDRFDYYHMWTTHTMEQLQEAFKPGGWYEGVKGRGGEWDHLGITTHADSKTIIQFLETGAFEVVTLPLNVVNTTRMDVVDYCAERNITVIAMNPLAGGFLAANERLKELALRFLFSLDNVHPLIGFASPEEAAYAHQILQSQAAYGRTTGQILQEAAELIHSDEPRCTACGYCQPCPEGINVGACLSYYNVYKYMKLVEAKEAFVNKQWEDGLRLDRCKSCGICESRCPNRLPVTAIIDDARTLLYAKA
jgi:predicted aldo/keto reductase-like oxidoreductase